MGAVVERLVVVVVDGCRISYECHVAFHRRVLVMLMVIWQLYMSLEEVRCKCGDVEFMKDAMVARRPLREYHRFGMARDTLHFADMLSIYAQ